MGRASIEVHDLGKVYRLGVYNRHTLSEEIQYWWHRVRGRNPADHMGKMMSRVRGSAHGGAAAARRMDDEDPGLFWALRDVTFTVEAGHVVGVIGRNGAGKSTLLKILSRITQPTEGEAFLDGRVGSLLEVGTGFHPELTGKENIYLNGTILGMRKREIDRKFDEIVAFAELEQFLDTPVKRYSSGMYVRLAFAVAAHLEPEILLVDEVLAVGDATFQRKCLDKMEDVSREGRTVIFVSHNMPAVARLCSTALLIDDGRVVESGPADQVVSHYLRRSSEIEVSRSWDPADAPGTEEVRLLGVAVTRSDGTPLSVARVDDELTVRLRYQVGRPNTGFRCLVSFCTQGMIAFATVEPRETVRLRKGVYTSSVTVPANLLAENEYVLNVAMFASRGVKMHYLKLKEAVAFQVTDPQTGESARGDYAEGLRGLVRPLLTWDTGAEPE